MDWGAARNWGGGSVAVIALVLGVDCATSNGINWAVFGYVCVFAPQRDVELSWLLCSSLVIWGRFQHVLQVR